MNTNEASLKLARSHGFDLWNTGGGCLAFHRMELDETYILITDSDGCGVDAAPDAEEWIVGRYAEAGGFVCVNESLSLFDAIAASVKLPRPDSDSEIVEEVFDSFALLADAISGGRSVGERHWMAGRWEF